MSHTAYQIDLTVKLITIGSRRTVLPSYASISLLEHLLASQVITAEYLCIWLMVLSVCK